MVFSVQYNIKVYEKIIFQRWIQEFGAFFRSSQNKRLLPQDQNHILDRVRKES
jgi:hypothetical protein